MKKMILCLWLTLFNMTAIAQEDSEECDGCWTPELKFDIEGGGFMSTLIFISGQSYALSMNNRELHDQGKQNFFCKESKYGIGSEILVDILNSKFEGKNITAEEATCAIFKGLKERFPCQ